MHHRSASVSLHPVTMPVPPGACRWAARQDLLLRAHRLSLIHGSAPFLGLQRSRAVPVPYHARPLLMALDASPVRLLIGDDVGIGKTIEAGLIVSELVARGAVQRILVVLPPALRELLFTRTPLSPSSIAAQRVRWTTAAFATS